jgi:hypothetical protein
LFTTRWFEHRPTNYQCFRSVCQNNLHSQKLNSILFKHRLIEISEDLEELDLDENVIGHVCGNTILEALKSRKESKLKKIKINVSEKIDQYVFADILKLSVKMKKKRKRTKKKVRT